MGTRSQISIWERACRAQFPLRAFLLLLRGNRGRQWKLGNKANNSLSGPSNFAALAGNGKNPPDIPLLFPLGEHCSFSRIGASDTTVAGCITLLSLSSS